MTFETRWPEFIGYYWSVESPPLDSNFLEQSNARLAELGLASVMEHVVVDERNATLFKGPQAEAFLAVHEDGQRRVDEFLKAGLHTLPKI